MPATTPKLKIPQTRRVALFRAVDNRLRTDPQLRSVVKTFRSWTGEAREKTAPSVEQCPWVRLSIHGGPLDWWAASTMTAELVVRVELMVQGTCLDDLDNLWGLVERACYPADPAAQLAFQAALRAAGALTGLVKLRQPAFDPSPEGGGGLDALTADGFLGLDYRFDTKPLSPGF